jgi:Ca2+-binding EF-hand superfamily protein
MMGLGMNETDSSVDFIELVEGLNMALFGSNEQRLLRLFRVFDIDDNSNHFLLLTSQ